MNSETCILSRLVIRFFTQEPLQLKLRISLMKLQKPTEVTLLLYNGDWKCHPQNMVAILSWPQFVNLTTSKQSKINCYMFYGLFCCKGVAGVNGDDASNLQLPLSILQWMDKVELVWTEVWPANYQLLGLLISLLKRMLGDKLIINSSDIDIIAVRNASPLRGVM